jgi:Ca2+-binding RTX toxin-like protein
MANLRGNDKPNRFGLYDGPTNESDTIFGFGGSDFIWALGGNDHITGGEGADIINGGPGFDTAYYDDSPEGVTVNLNAGGGRYGTAEGDILISIEALVGSPFNDIFFGSDIDDNSFRGNAGEDQISGFGGNDWIQGGAGADRIDGGEGYDYADYSDAVGSVVVSLAVGYASDGDRLYAIEGLYGSSYSDQLLGNTTTNFLYGGDGDDLMFGLGGADGLNGEAGDDTLDGGTGSDVLNGGSGSDFAVYLSAAAGVTASLSNPLLNTGDASGDVYVSIEDLVGSYHGDVLQGDDRNNIIGGLDGADLLEGLGGQDTLVGGAHGDWLFGGDGNDVLGGEDGDDVLYGGMNGPSYDTLEGGAGGDRYAWNTLAEMGSDGAYDLVVGFNAADGDRIDLSAIDADPVAFGRQRFTFIDRSDPGRGQIGYDASTNSLVFNIDDDASPEARIVLQDAGSTPSASWFML